MNTRFLVFFLLFFLYGKTFLGMNVTLAAFAEKKIVDCKTLGIKIRERRSAMGLTQAEIAGICNVGLRFVSELENGKTTVEFGKVLNVLQGLGLEFLLRSKTWM